MEEGRAGGVECVFCAIVGGRAPAAVVYQDEDCVAFLDHRPVFPGHCLLVTRRHLPTLADLPADRIGPFFHAVQRLSRAVEAGTQAHGTFVAVNNRVSQSVPHLHVHIVPRRFKDGLRGFFWPRQKYASPEEVDATRRAIVAAVARLSG